jgi:hypothetical protein
MAMIFNSGRISGYTIATRQGGQAVAQFGYPLQT